MRIEDREVVTRQTYLVARYLLVTASIVLAIEIYSIQISNLKILNVDLPTELYKPAVSVILGFGIYNLAINLWSDFLAWRYWFETSKASQGTIVGDRRRIIDDLDQTLIKLADDRTPQEVKQAVENLVPMLKRWRRRYSTLSWLSRYFHIVHHGLLPFGLAVAALCLVFF